MMAETKKWQKKLTPEQYNILREKGTEPAFSGKLLDNEKAGMYHCAACGQKLFSAETKYESGSGWPSFWEAVDSANLNLIEDNLLGMKRVEVACGKCGSHLGHLFNDGPQPTGKRYCINSLALDFKPEPKK